MAQSNANKSRSTSQTKSTQTYQAPPPDLEEDKGSSFGRVVANIVHGFSMVAITLLTFRFFLLLLGANPTSGFVNFIYRTSDVVMAPFDGIFPTQAGENSVHILDFSALFAIIAYALLAYWMSRLIKRYERADKVAEWNAQQQMIQSQSTVTETTTTKKAPPIQ